MKSFTTTLLLLLPIVLFCQTQIVKLNSESTKDGYAIYAKNNAYCSYSVKITFRNVKNLSGAPSPNLEMEVPPGRTKLLSLRKVNEEASTNFNFSYTYRKGKVVRELKEDFLYLIPIRSDKLTKVDTMFYIGDRYGKQEEKERPKNFYSLSFTTEVGDTIFAARGGRVSMVKENYEEQGVNLRYKKQVNQLEIYHKDGTFGLYRLFQKDGIFVSESENIEPGQAIGIIGGEPFENGSHLRFQVYYAHKDGGNANVLPHFETKESKGPLIPNKVYTSIHSEIVLTQEMSRRQIKKRKSKRN